MHSIYFKEEKNTKYASLAEINNRPKELLSVLQKVPDETKKKFNAALNATLKAGCDTIGTIRNSDLNRIKNLGSKSVIFLKEAFKKEENTHYL